MFKNSEALILGAFISYLLGVFIVPFVIDWSQKGGLVDVPNERKIHTTPISRLGGIAIWLSTMLTFLFLVDKVFLVNTLFIFLIVPFTT